LGAGWQLSAVIDAAAGRIAITLYSTTPIATDQAGSLVQIAFHPRSGVMSTESTVRLVNSVEIGGQQFVTQLDDARGGLLLTPGVDSLTLPLGRHRPAGRFAHRRSPAN
jgi:hypothetical protein